MVYTLLIFTLFTVDNASDLHELLASTSLTYNSLAASTHVTSSAIDVPLLQAAYSFMHKAGCPASTSFRRAEDIDDHHAKTSIDIFFQVNV